MPVPALLPRVTTNGPASADLEAMQRERVKLFVTNESKTSRYQLLGRDDTILIDVYGRDLSTMAGASYQRRAGEEHAKRVREAVSYTSRAGSLSQRYGLGSSIPETLDSAVVSQQMVGGFSMTHVNESALQASASGSGGLFSMGFGSQDGLWKRPVAGLGRMGLAALRQSERRKAVMAVDAAGRKRASLLGVAHSPTPHEARRTSPTSYHRKAFILQPTAQVGTSNASPSRGPMPGLTALSSTAPSSAGSLSSVTTDSLFLPTVPLRGQRGATTESDAGSGSEGGDSPRMQDSPRGGGSGGSGGSRAAPRPVSASLLPLRPTTRGVATGVGEGGQVQVNAGLVSPLHTLTRADKARATYVHAVHCDSTMPGTADLVAANQNIRERDPEREVGPAYISGSLATMPTRAYKAGGALDRPRTAEVHEARRAVGLPVVPLPNIPSLPKSRVCTPSGQGRRPTSSLEMGFHPFPDSYGPTGSIQARIEAPALAYEHAPTALADAGHPWPGEALARANAVGKPYIVLPPQEESLRVDGGRRWNAWSRPVTNIHSSCTIQSSPMRRTVPAAFNINIHDFARTGEDGLAKVRSSQSIGSAGTGTVRPEAASLALDTAFQAQLQYDNMAHSPYRDTKAFHGRIAQTDGRGVTGTRVGMQRDEAALAAATTWEIRELQRGARAAPASHGRSAPGSVPIGLMVDRLRSMELEATMGNELHTHLQAGSGAGSPSRRPATPGGVWSVTAAIADPSATAKAVSAAESAASKLEQAAAQALAAASRRPRTSTGTGATLLWPPTMPVPVGHSSLSRAESNSLSPP